MSGRSDWSTMILETGVVSLTRLGTYRDGGSISASFRGADGIDYCLFFGIRGRRMEGELASYRSPRLEWFGAAEYRSPVTGDISPVGEKDSAPVTWPEARRVLKELVPLYEDFSSEYRWVFGEMVDAAAEDGR